MLFARACREHDEWYRIAWLVHTVRAVAGDTKLPSVEALIGPRPTRPVEE